MHHPKEEKTLDQCIDELKVQLDRASELGIRGINMSNRVEGDLKRIINSSWLNLYEYSSDQEERNKIDLESK